MQEKQRDRVSVSLGKKVNVGNYESLDFHVSLSTDCEDNETSQDAAKRAYKEVKAWLDNISPKKTLTK